MTEIPKMTRDVIRDEDVGFSALFSSNAPRGYNDYLDDDELDEVIRRAEAYPDIVRLGKGFIEIVEEVLEDEGVMANVELAYKFRQKKEVFEQALKEADNE